MCNFVVIAVYTGPANGLAPFGARTSAGTAMTETGSRIDTVGTGI